ncbi:SAM-dependent methyltransferase [Saccharomonospora sp. NPDC006951]
MGTVGAVAGTAVGPMTIVAIDQHEATPLVRDQPARSFLPATARTLAALARFRSIRRLLFAATERKLPGLWASILCRKRYLDDDIVDALESGCTNVVVLGAGLDDRVCRMPALASASVFEVDLLCNITTKYRRLHALCGDVPGNLTLVPINLATEDLPRVLARHGYDAAQPTYFLCEALTQYLSAEDIHRTLDALAAAPAGSRLGFTYILDEFVTGEVLHGGHRAHREYVATGKLWRSGMNPRQVRRLLQERGWQVREDVGAEQYTERYLEPLNRDLCATPVERVVTAAKTG